ncbi:hypothetical protein HKX48_001622 [Thoreauomyces humboldtii]|nr:hypothetical protein HKX48_001622 [Thoreauomyces humboldtii]
MGRPASISKRSESPPAGISLRPPPRKNSGKFEPPTDLGIPTVELHASPTLNMWNTEPEGLPLSSRNSVSDVGQAAGSQSATPSVAMEDTADEADGEYETSEGGPSSESTLSAQELHPASDDSDYDDSFDAMQYHLYGGAGVPTEAPPAPKAPAALGKDAASSNQSFSHSNGSSDGIHNGRNRAAPAAEPTFPARDLYSPDAASQSNWGRPEGAHPPTASIVSKYPRFSQMPFQTKIFSGFLQKQNRHNSFQTRLFRQLLRDGDDFAQAVRLHYPTPPIHAIPNTLLSEADEAGNPIAKSKVFFLPKFTIPTSSILSVRSVVQQPSPTPNAKKSRTFIIRTKFRDYTLCAPTADDFRRWTYLLSRFSMEIDDIRRDSMEEEHRSLMPPTPEENNERTKKFLEKSAAWQRCVRELQGKDPKVDRGIAEAEGEITMAVPDAEQVASPHPPPSPEPQLTGEAMQQLINRRGSSSRRSSLLFRPPGAPDLNALPDDHPSSFKNVVQRPDLITRGSMSTVAHTESTLVSEYHADPKSRAPSASATVPGGAPVAPVSVNDIERELSVLHRVPAAEDVAPSALSNPSSSVKPTEPASSSSHREPAKKLPDPLVADLESILRLIAHIRGEFMDEKHVPRPAPGVSGMSVMAGTHRRPSARIIRHYLTASIPSLLDSVSKIIPRYPAVLSVADDWELIASRWDPAARLNDDMSNADVEVVELSMLVKHMLVCLR